MIVEKIVRENFFELTALSHKVFGVGYLTDQYFQKVINDLTYKGYIVFFEGELVAFCVIYKTRKELLESNLNEILFSVFSSNELICLDTIVVSQNFRRKGLATQLIKKVIEEHKEAVIYLNAWKQNGSVNLDPVISKLGFKVYKEYLDVWKTDCEINKFSCPSKKVEKSCCCSSVLYYRLPK